MTVPSISHRAPFVMRRFALEAKVFSTLSTDVFGAVGKEQPIPVTLLLIRGGLDVENTESAEFAQRVRTLMAAGLCSALEVGVDDENIAFVILPQLEGASLSSGRIERAEAERRFLNAARILAKVHELGLCCGDLTPHSWWVSRSGDVSLIAPLGIPARYLGGDAMPPGEDEDPVWRELLAPEVVAGETPTPASDVYSLAALGQKLLGQFLASDKGSYLTPIFAAALADDPLLRPTTASMLLEQIQSARSETQAALTTRRSGAIAAPGIRPADGSTMSVHVGKPLETVNDEAESDAAEATEAPAAPRRSGISRPVLAAVLSLLIVVSFVVGTRLAANDQQRRKEQEARRAQLEMVAGNAALEQAVRVLSHPETSLQERQVELEKLTNSDDPLAHELLVKTAMRAGSEEERLLAERAIVERARRLGMLRSAEQARTWLRSLKALTLPAEYESVLRLLNANLPDEARLTFIKQILAHDDLLATRLTAAEALDLQVPSLTELLAQLVGERTKIADTAGKHLLPLLLADPELASLYGDDVIQRREQLGLPDLVWVLPILADRNDQAIRPLANLALERSAISPVRALFLELMRDREDLSPEVLNTLVRAATDKATIADIATLGRWIDTGAEQALLALCATLPPEDPRSLEAFDTMAGRSGSVEPASSMVEWIREYRWPDRAQYVQAVGGLSFADRMSKQELDEMLGRYEGALRDPSLLEVLVRNTTPKVSGMLVSRFGDKLGMGGLVNLLSHPEKEVRIAAIKGLSQVNEASVLRLVLERYQDEKDNDVRKAYQESFWVVRERGNR